MRRTWIRAGLLPALLLGAVAAWAQDDFSKVEVTSTKLADGVYMLTGAGGNIGACVGPDGVFLVDDLYAPMTPKIAAAVKALSDRPLRFLVNTHWHGDHTGGNETLGKAGVVIVAHDNVRKRMTAEQFISAFDERVPPAPAVALPVITFADSVSFHVNGQAIEVFHVAPAHTDGDSVIHFRDANVIHMGDLFFNGLYPFIDVDTGGGIEGMIAAADAVLARTSETTKLIPGHGPAGTPADLRVFRDMLRGVRDAVAPLVKAGKTRAEVVAAHPSAPWDGKWGNGFLKPEAFVGIVYNDLAKRQAK
jgi:glyoxylase-like metal-dependent hydrolase (beta-lactamase superfamily II)